ncbi:DUF4037 domain-containing protein [Microlunatus elymi]|uniref:DUF4037 domain-containing protein n=1 Tax=Microlunatus elymi TaxID=2596828 RepID=A0A516PXI7_9ACTN|nr:DUF4037 domain-containing protein [Microlunatus elymi]QDP95894.1 DUF4037 domain-containing protein [Microlunatus elymi]
MLDASGIELCRRFYQQQVRPSIAALFPGLPHAAALLGRGSEVLGFDDKMSSDHDWQPRTLIFVDDRDESTTDVVEAALRGVIPERFEGYPTGLTVTTTRSYLQEQLAIDIKCVITPTDWLTLPEQRLRMMAGGTVYHDEVGLRESLDRISYYPDDVWRYLMLAAWWRIHPEMNLVGRIGYVGDDLGSRLITADMVDGIMRLCFLLEREYAPYRKWFGTAFSRLKCGAVMVPILQRALSGVSWPDREAALIDAYRELAAMHNAARVTDFVPTELVRMCGRPFGVHWGDFPGALRQAITDPEVLRIAELWPTGDADRVREWIWLPKHRHRLVALASPH